jgi:hypothetical protein
MFFNSFMDDLMATAIALDEGMEIENGKQKKTRLIAQYIGRTENEKHRANLS